MAIFSGIAAAIGLSGTFATIFVGGLKALAGIGLNKLAVKLAGKKRPNEPQFSVKGQLQRGADLSQSFLVGKAATAGSLAYANTWGQDGGTPNAYLTMVISLSDYPVQSLDALWVNGEPATLAEQSQNHPEFGTPVTEFSKARTVSKIVGYEENGDHDRRAIFETEEVTDVWLWVKFYDGTQTAADDFLVNKVSDDERPWDATCVGKNTAYAVVTARVNGEYFNGFPTFLFELTGARFYDPSRDSSVGGDGAQRWSDPATWGGDGDHLPAVQLYNLWRGMRLDGEWFYGLQDLAPAQLPAHHWIAQINKCRASIEGADGPEPKFRSGGEVSVGVPIVEAMEALLDACQGRMSEAGGIYKIFVGAPDSPVAIITDADILSSEEQSFTPFFGLADTVNGINGKFPDPNQNWQMETAPPLHNAGYEAEDGARRLMVDVSFDLVPYEEQVQRLMLASLSEARRARRHTFVLPHRFWVLEPGDVITWTSERNGYHTKQFRVDGIEDLPNADVMADLTEVDPTDYDFNTEVDFTSSMRGSLVGAPLGVQEFLGWSVRAWYVTDDTGQGRRPAILVSWNTLVEDVVAVRVQVRVKDTGHVSFSGRFEDFEEGSGLISQGVLPGGTYQLRGLYVPGSSRPVNWSEWLDVTVEDLRLTSADLDETVNQAISDAKARADAAFEKHTETRDEAAQAISTLRGEIVGSLGPLDGATPLQDRIELAFGPLDVETSLTARFNQQVQRLDLQIPQIRQSANEVSRVWEALIDLEAARGDTDLLIRRAGIRINEETGVVEIDGLAVTNERILQVALRADALKAEITQKASVAFVQDMVSNAVLDPTQVPVVGDIKLRLSSVETTLSAEMGRIDNLSTLLTVEGQQISMVTVTTQLDNLQEAINQRVLSTDFDEQVTRINGVESLLSTLGDVSKIVQTTTAVREQAHALDDQIERSIADAWDAYEGREALRRSEAAARQEMRSQVDDQFAAEAALRTELTAKTDATDAQLASEIKVRAEQDKAAVERMDQLQADLTDTDDKTAANATALDQIKVDVTRNEDGLTAQAGRTEVFGAALRDLDGASDDEIARTIADVWDKHERDLATRRQMALSVRNLETILDENKTSEASERELLGAQIDSARADLASERRARATQDTATSQRIDTLRSDLAATDERGAAQATATEGLLTRAGQTEEAVSALSQRATVLEGATEDLEDDVEAIGTATETLSQETTKNADGLTAQAGRTEVLGAAIRELDGASDDDIERVITEAWDAWERDKATRQDTALSVRNLHTRLDDAQQAEATERSLLGAQLENTRAALISEARARATADKATSQRIDTLQSELDDADAGRAAQAEATDGLRTDVDAMGEDVSSLAQRSTNLETQTGDLETAQEATGKAVDNLQVKTTLTDDELTSLTAQHLVLTSAIRGGQVLPNGDLATGDFRGWQNVPSTFAVVPRGTGAAALQAAPTPFVIQIDHDSQSQRASPVKHVPVQGGVQFRATMQAAGDNAQLVLRFAFYDADGTYLSAVERSSQLLGGAWQSIEMAPVVVPIGAVTMWVYLRRNAGGTGPAYAADLRVERGSLEQTAAEARIDELAATKVDAAGAVAAFNQEISSEFGSLLALAQASAFAKAQADRISAGFIWRLNGDSVLELVSTADGTSGNQVTALIDADYIRLTGQTQVDEAFITQLAVSQALVDNLVVNDASIGTLQLAGNAVTIPVRTFSADIIDVTSTTDWVDVATLDIEREGFATELEFSASFDGAGSGVVELGFYRGVDLVTAAHLASATGGQQTFINFPADDFDTGTGPTTYRVRARKLPGSADLRLFKRRFKAVQFKR
jgi:hypothetical protein